MNKLVIIGNGFDLAHGLKTRYEDFLLWYINEKLIYNFTYRDENRQMFGSPSLPKMNSVAEFRDYAKKATGLNPNYSHSFIKHLIDQSVLKNWVDIEKEYYDQLVEIYTDYKPGFHDRSALTNLNAALDLIRIELENYLLSNVAGKAERKHEIYDQFYEIGNSDNYLDLDINKTTMMVLNFNYTDTFKLYFDKQTFPQYVENYIHGRLNDLSNRIIFGYGDETDEYFEKLENSKDNKFLMHMKSFAYLQTPNYKELFKFLDQEQLAEDKREKFDVYIMGHSCGVSDRLLFTHIFEHPLLNSVKLYFYERPDGTNDFYEKTQELSRHFRKDAKHKMRKCIVPFNESKPLTIYKP